MIFTVVNTNIEGYPFLKFPLILKVSRFQDLKLQKS